MTRFSNYLLLALFLAIGSNHIYSQKILLKIGDLTATDGEEVKALEWKVDAPSSWVLGGGVSIGKPAGGILTIKYDHNKSGDAIFRRITTGASFPEVLIEYYDATDLLYYSIKLTDAFVTQYYHLSPECPGCLKLEHQVSFVYKTVTLTDPINETITTWNVTNNLVQ
jgi:type VI protein secretion system component Hcp